MADTAAKKTLRLSYSYTIGIVAMEGRGFSVLAPDGGFIEKLRGEATPSKWADEFFEANADEAAARARSNITPPLDPEVATAHEESARTEPYFWGPVSVKLDSRSRLYVTESNRHRIQVYETV